MTSDSEFATYTRNALQSRIDEHKKSAFPAVRFMFTKSDDGGYYWQLWKQHMQFFVNELIEQGHGVDIIGFDLMITPNGKRN